MSLKAAMDELEEALRAAHVPLWEPPSSSVDVEELAPVVAPFGIPEDAAEFWRQVSVPSLCVAMDPPLVEPDFAIRSWELDHEAFDHPVLPLLTVGYQSHTSLMVELDVGEIKGGALFEMNETDGQGFVRRFNTFPAWMLEIARMVREGWYMRYGGGDPRIVLPDPARSEGYGAAQTPPSTHRVHGDRTAYFRQSEWPAHWT